MQSAAHWAKQVSQPEVEFSSIPGSSRPPEEGVHTSSEPAGSPCLQALPLGL
jgi:hypothetical protein